MNTILEYPNINTESFALGMCNRDGMFCNPVYNWLMNGKLPEDIAVMPLYKTQTITEAAKNRYLNSVEVAAITPAVIAMTIAVGATATFNFAGIASAVSANPSYATAVESNGIVTVTGIAAGTTTIVILDSFSDKIATITVTVSGT